MDLSTTPVPPPCRAVALLIDGENIPAALAPAALTAARRLGPVATARVYGDARLLAGWHEVPGVRIVHAHSGKNVTDMLLTVEAMDLSHSGVIDGFALATQDRDFAPLAQSLRSRGIPVLALTGAQTPRTFTESCTASQSLLPSKPAPKPAPIPAPDPLEHAALALLRGGALHPKDFAQALKDKGHSIPAPFAKWRSWAKSTFPALKITGEGTDCRMSLPRP